MGDAEREEHKLLKTFLGKGIFPKEIPECFTTQQFSEVVISQKGDLPDGFSEGDYKPTPVTKVASHNLARAGGLRRALSIVNPIRYFNLAETVSIYWEEISDFIESENISRTHPKINDKIDRSIKLGNHGGRVYEKSKERRHGEYILNTDIKNFYGSIYTHGISWAYHGKKFASKQENHFNQELIGNKIDEKVKSLQSKRTNGIPVGPDMSHVVSEIMLARVDKEVREELDCIHGVRWIDDYELVFKNRREATRALHVLQSYLSKYNLALNEEKTDIYRMPKGLEQRWQNELRRFRFRGTKRKRENDILQYFNLAFNLADEYETDPVLSYAISRLENFHFRSPVWEVYSDLLIQSAMCEAGCLDYVVSEFDKYRGREIGIPEEKLASLASQMIVNHAPIGHGSEVVWALWMAIRFGLRISEEARDCLYDIDDPLVPVLAFDADDRGLIPSPFDRSIWDSLMQSDELKGPNWLFAYEAERRGWTATRGTSGYLDGNGAFSLLDRNDVNFYDPDEVGDLILPRSRKTRVPS